MFKQISQTLFALMIGFTLSVQAQDSGFLTDYSQLTSQDDLGLKNTRSYQHPDALTTLGKYQAIMIDQPELIVAADSKVKSLKPDDMVQVAEAMRTALSDKLTENYFIVDKPGPEVLLLRVAASNLYLKKAKRGFLSYTPIGAVAHAAKQAATDDLAKKISLVEVSIEGEVQDSMSGEVLAAFINERGQRKDKKKKLEMEPSSWNELMGMLDMVGARIACRMDNARIDVSEWQDCIALFPEPEQPEEE